MEWIDGGSSVEKEIRESIFKDIITTAVWISAANCLPAEKFFSQGYYIWQLIFRMISIGGFFVCGIKKLQLKKAVVIKETPQKNYSLMKRFISVPSVVSIFKM